MEMLETSQLTYIFIEIINVMNSYMLKHMVKLSDGECYQIQMSFFINSEKYKPGNTEVNVYGTHQLLSDYFNHHETLFPSNSALHKRDGVNHACKYVLRKGKYS
jgi:hypothetical protein